jgi:hypothetical protein
MSPKNTVPRKKVKLSLCLTNQALRHEDVWGSGYIRVDPRFLDLTLVGGERSVPHPGRFTPWARARGAHWIGGWMDPRAGLDMKQRKFLLSRAGCSKSLHPLRYPGSLIPHLLCK